MFGYSVDYHFFKRMNCNHSVMWTEWSALRYTVLDGVGYKDS